RARPRHGRRRGLQDDAPRRRGPSREAVARPPRARRTERPRRRLRAPRARRARPQHEVWGELLWLARIVEDADVARAGPPRLAVSEAALRDAAALLAE